MSELLNALSLIIRREIEKPEWKNNVLKPVLISILPYALGIICLNFFLTIAAISLVLYMHNVKK